MLDKIFKQKDNKAKSKYSLMDTLVFVVAVIALSKFFGAAHYFETGDADLQGLLVILSSTAVFVLCLTFLAYSIYSEEKSKNNLRKNFFFFDWIETKIEQWRESIQQRKQAIKEVKEF